MAVLTRADINSDTWKRITAHLLVELETSRERLESTKQTVEGTAHLRGDIARIRKLLALAPDPAKAPVSRSRGTQVDDDDQGFEP